MELSEWAHSMEIVVFHVNTHQKASSEEEAFNNQMDKMTVSYCPSAITSSHPRDFLMGPCVEWPCCLKWRLYVGPALSPSHQA